MSNTLRDEDTKAIKNVLVWIDAFRAVRKTMPLQHAYTFLLVAMTEGRSVSEYAERAGVAQTVMTRHLLDIGQQTRDREPGLGLVMTKTNPTDMRQKQAFLTPDGKALLHKIIRAAKP
jgi:DNA-binding MarR family transcriptional regulator